MTDAIPFLLTVLERKSITSHEELIINVLGAITNLSYYGTDSNLIIKLEKEITLSTKKFSTFVTPTVLVRFLDYDNEEAVIETIRALGNFSRDDVIRNILISNESESVSSHSLVKQFLLLASRYVFALLASPCEEIASQAIGVLMNLLADPNCHKILVQMEVPGTLVSLFLATCGQIRERTEFLLNLCKAIYNLW